MELIDGSNNNISCFQKMSGPAEVSETENGGKNPKNQSVPEMEIVKKERYDSESAAGLHNMLWGMRVNEEKQTNLEGIQKETTPNNDPKIEAGEEQTNGFRARNQQKWRCIDVVDVDGLEHRIPPPLVGVDNNTFESYLVHRQLGTQRGLTSTSSDRKRKAEKGETEVEEEGGEEEEGEEE